jgi:hypothetical protein
MENATSETHNDSHHHDEISETHRHSHTSTLQGRLLSQNSTNHDNILTVDWDGPDDPENPRKYALSPFSFCVRLTALHVRSWSFRQKWGATAIVSAFTFISPVSSSMIAPASTQLAERFDIHSSVLLAMTTSVFVLGYGGYFVILTYLSQRLLIACFRSYRSIWTVTFWPAERAIWTLSRVTNIKSVVPQYVPRASHVFHIVANGTFLLPSLEYGVWVCAQQGRVDRISLPSGTRWFCPTRYRWRCDRRSLRRRTPGTGNFHILTCSPSRSCRRSRRWGLDRREINMALGGVSLFRNMS